MSGRVLVVGSLNMDVVCEVDCAPEAGETVLGTRVSFVHGGKGANQAVACARMGGAVAMIGRVGSDEFGVRLRSALEAEGIDATDVGSASDSATGIALIVVDAAAQNRITVVPGANALLSAAMIDAARPMFEAAAVVLLQLETPLATVSHAILTAKRADAAVLLNPAPAQPLPDAWWQELDYIVPNETEASLLTGIAVNDDATAIAAAQEMRRRGAGCVLLTLGARGVLILDAAPARFIAAPLVRAVDTTAAGDTFIGAFAAALAEGLTTDAAAALAVRAASLSVTRGGAQTSIPTRQELR